MSQRGSESPPSSLSLHRTRNSPPRHTPYDSDHRLSLRSQNENWNVVGPGQPGNFQSQYLQYNGSGGGYDERTPFSTLQPSQERSSRMPSLTTIVSVDELSAQYELDSSQRKAAHAFRKLGSEDRLVMLFLRLLRAEHQNNQVQAQIQQIQTHLEGIAQFCVQTWKPSEEQKKLLKALLRHYIIRPITSYTNLVPIVETYILDHAKQLRLGLYKEDPTVKAVVRELLMKENGNLRSTLRKLVWTSVKEKSSLEFFSKAIVDAYHLPTKPATPPNEIMACMALMRKVAKPLVKKESARGGDTGFWRDVEARLDVLFEKNGNERDSPKWRKWEQDIIDEDNRMYNRRAAESNARTQEEIDAAVLTSHPDGAATAVGQDDDDDEDGMAHEDREVHLSGLGDLAALAAGPVARSEV